HAGEVFGPRLQVGVVKRVGGGADLKDDGVEMQGGAAVEDVEHLALLLIDGEPRLAGPVGVADAGDPGGAKFTRRGRGIVGDGLGDGECAAKNAENAKSAKEEILQSFFLASLASLAVQRK